MNDSTPVPPEDITPSLRIITAPSADDPFDPPTAAYLPTPPAVESTGPSRQALVMALVAVFFFAAGLLAGGLLLGAKPLDTQELASLVRSVVAEEVAKVGSAGDPALANLADNDPFFGAEDASITIVEFSDFYCTFCGRFATQTLPQIKATYGDKIKFVYRDMPIIGGQASVDAAIAAGCAEDQGKFWEFHNLLFTNPGAKDATARLAFAGELGMDTAAYEACLIDKSKADEVTLDLLDGQGLGISGTPAFYINGRFVSGAQPFETFQLLIDTELRKQGLE